MALTHFKDLDVWQIAMQLAKQVYQLTAEFPSNERYGLSAQLQRSAVSIPSNIAEGNARGSTKDYARFVAYAQGSCAELQTQLLLARELGVANHELCNGPLATCDRVGQMLLRLHQSLARRLKAESRVPSPESR
ncbi:MAG: four helix bundle protein [Lysobacterales bacterium]